MSEWRFLSCLLSPFILEVLLSGFLSGSSMQLLATFAVAQLEGVLFHVIWAEGRYLMPDRGPTQIHPIAHIGLRKNLN